MFGDALAHYNQRGLAQPLRAGIAEQREQVVEDRLTGCGDHVHQLRPVAQQIVGAGRALRQLTAVDLDLLDPGTAIERLGETDDGHQQLAVRLAGRGLDPRKTYVLHVESDGRLAGYDVGAAAASRRNFRAITATTPTGPLTLPSTLTLQSRRAREYRYDDLTWNPEAPEGLTESRELLLE